ncbi:hypothetical protein GCM10010267_46760 [Streptomyces griseorubens]|nr:hypothetical protein GCM10010267_46760 [Streptomyces griseorubens]
MSLPRRGSDLRFYRVLQVCSTVLDLFSEVHRVEPAVGSRRVVHLRFHNGSVSPNALLNSVRDGFKKCLDARSTLFLTECEVEVLGPDGAGQSNFRAQPVE